MYWSLLVELDWVPGLPGGPPPVPWPNEEPWRLAPGWQSLEPELVPATKAVEGAPGLLFMVISSRRKSERT